MKVRLVRQLDHCRLTYRTYFTLFVDWKGKKTQVNAVLRGHRKHCHNERTLLLSTLQDNTV